jgi:hypothetical protein
MDDNPPPKALALTPPSSPSSSLPDEARKRIIAEELFRLEVQKELRKGEVNLHESKFLKFVNSPFGLFVLGAIFISGLGGAFQSWSEKLKQVDAGRETQKRIMSEYRWRLNDLDALIKETESTDDVEVKGADSILIYRIAYGANEYQTSLPEFKSEPWSSLIRRLDEFANSESAAQAVAATTVLMSGPYIGQDTHKRGYFGPTILEDRAKTLHLYYNNVSEKVYDTSVFRAFR